jgi:hypothetical protein
MKPTQEQAIEWARKSGVELYGLGRDRTKFDYYLEIFAALAYEAGRKDKREWQGLTDAEAEQIVDDYWHDVDMFIETIEAKLKEKNS